MNAHGLGPQLTAERSSNGNLAQIVSAPVHWQRGRNFDDVIGGAQRLVDDLISSGRTLQVLEAGCGSRSVIQLGPKRHLVGIDISEEQLGRNATIDEKILGDIQTFRLEPRKFDIVLCWDVLEHLRHPGNALDNFRRSLREGGIIVLAGPVLNSVKGIITKFTPHWFHVLAYRLILGYKAAGKKGCGPFRTFLRTSMSPRSIQRFAQQHQLTIEYFSVYEDDVWHRTMKQNRIIGAAFLAFGILLNFASLGWIDPNITDLIIVLRKPATNEVESTAKRVLSK